MSPIDELAQSLDRQITDDEGQPIEENDTPLEDQPALEQQTTEDEDAQAEKPAESEVPGIPTGTEEDEINKVELASDETGKRYVPETRFDKVYGQKKAAERRAEEAERRVRELESQGYTPKQAKNIANTQINKIDQVESELLRATLPQLNPENPDYSREIDEMAFDIYNSKANLDAKGNHYLTMVEAGRRAIARAKKISSNIAKEVAETRSVKSQQSDQGITSRVTSRGTSDVPGEDASPEEMESWLKAHGQW
jgi:hypothetical protein